MAEQIRKKPRGRQPITRHPLFPATVALWCGAILSLVGAVAAPRLGVPLILGLGVIGAVAGLVAVRRLAQPKASAAAAPAPANAIVATESASPLWSELQSRRRELEDEEQADLDFVEPTPPVLVREPEILDITIADSAPLPDEAPLESVAEAVVVESAPESAAEIASPSQPKPESAAAARLKQADLEDLSHLQLLERLALGLERRRGEFVADGEAAPTSHVAALKKSYQALVDLAQQVPPAPLAEPEAPVVFPAEAERRPAPRPAGPPMQATATALAYDPAETPETADQPQDPAETEKALRAALAALQRMSGAA